MVAFACKKKHCAMAASSCTTTVTAAPDSRFRGDVRRLSSASFLRTPRQEDFMGTIDQPKPSRPGSPVPEPRPLQPGTTDDGRMNSTPGTRTNIQTPERIKEEIGETDAHDHERRS